MGLHDEIFMKIVVVHIDSLTDCLAASSVNAGLLKKYKDAHITWIVANDDAKSIFSFNENVQALTIDEFKMMHSLDIYDIFINLSCNLDRVPIVHSKDKKGFYFEPKNDKYRVCICGDSFLDMNIFQIYYRVAGMSWRGEGYDIHYYPKTKRKKSRVGLAMANANLRNFIRDNLDLEISKLWTIPYKKNLFKRMDEINRCQSVVTDDALTMHLALALRKKVYFLQVLPVNFKIEMFNSGEVYSVPLTYWK